MYDTITETVGCLIHYDPKAIFLGFLKTTIPENDLKVVVNLIAAAKINTAKKWKKRNAVFLLDCIEKM